MVLDRRSYAATASAMSCSGPKLRLCLPLEEHERVVAEFSENGANRGAHEDVAQKVHAENDPGSGNQHCNCEQASQKLGIKEADGNGHGERRDRVA